MRNSFAVVVLTLGVLTGCYRQQIATIDQVPAPVRSSFEQVATGGNIQNIQLRKRNGKEFYLAECRDNRGSWWDVSVLPDGTIIGKD